MFWKICKSLLDEIYLYVDVTNVFFMMHVETLHSLFKKCLGPTFVEEWKCLMCPWLLYVLKYVGMFKSINRGPTGAKNPEIIEFGALGPSHNKIEILLNQNEAE